MVRELLSTIWAAAVGANGKEAAAGGATALFGIVISFLGGWDQGLQILLWLMVADYVSGVLGAIKEKRVSSDVMFWGGIRKITVLFVVGLAAQIDAWLNMDTDVIRIAAIYFYAGREGLSFVENLGTLGVPLPAGVKSFLVQLQAKGGGDDGKGV